MKKLTIIIMIMCIVHGTGLLYGERAFEKVQQWKHESEAFGFEFFSFIDKDDHLVGGFFKSGCQVITPGATIKFAPPGTGPNELTNFYGAFPLNDDLAVFEMPGKIKVFTKKNGTYTWKETIWTKRGTFAQIVKEGIFLDDKIFIAGLELLKYSESERQVSFITIHTRDGKRLKNLVTRTYTTPENFCQMRYHVIGYKTDRVLFLKENELKVTVISAQKLEIIQEIDLETPTFYKKMPADFYVFKKYNNPKENYRLDMETWAMGYSAITEAALDGDYLAVQIRTPGDNLKKFALLFYNIANNYKLEKTVFTDDYLLDIKDGKYYCFANGNPGRDEDTDECIINIYAWQKQK